MLADLPVSAIAYVLAWMHGTAATVWIVIAGTLWWYLLGLGIDVLVNRFKRNPQHLSHLGSAEKQ
ncbi:MAG TPA: hypothetical protein VGU63_15155 [Candidatus Acidoferrales bacterium]|nr:hypothetical protein [Candidatus Acidoferrales bacterium]